jgi:hypothetical protein
MHRVFKVVSSHMWETECPACESKAFLAGTIYSEEISEEQDDDNPDDEYVEISYVAEEFRCPSRDLILDNRDQIEAAELEVERMEMEVRQREYEPEYGNE